jgi:hypothetical protein
MKLSLILAKGVGLGGGGAADTGAEVLYAARDRGASAHAATGVVVLAGDFALTKRESNGDARANVRAWDNIIAPSGGSVQKDCEVRSKKPLWFCPLYLQSWVIWAFDVSLRFDGVSDLGIRS